MVNYTYILGCFTGSVPRTYVGWTNELDKRLAAHNSGTGAKSTRGRVWVLLYAEKYPTRSAAMSREWHLKRDRKLRKRVTSGLSRHQKKAPPPNKPGSDALISLGVRQPRR